MSHGSIGAYGSNNLGQVLSKLLARLDDAPDAAATDPAQPEAKAERQGCGDRKHPPRGEARLSSQILNVLLRLQQQEEASATDDATATDAASGDTATTEGATASGATASGTATDTNKSPVHRLFVAIDSSADGSIDKEELEGFITAKGGTVDEADKLFAILDKDSDGAVSEEQLAASIRRGHHGHHHGGIGLTELAQKLFAKIDGDSDGKVTKEEMTGFVTSKGGSADKVEAKFAKLDTNGDGSLDQAELTAALRGRMHGRPFGHFRRDDVPAVPETTVPTPVATTATDATAAV